MFTTVCLWVVIGAAVLGGVLFAWTWLSDFDGFRGDTGFLGAIFGGSMIFGLLTVIVSVVLGFVLDVTGVFGPDQDNMSIGARQPLKAIAAGDSVHGEFFLGSGSIDGKPVIKYATTDEHGAVRIAQVDADRAFIYEDAPEGTAHMTADLHWKSKPALWDGKSGEITLYAFHIPKGSVVENYKVDISK